MSARQCFDGVKVYYYEFRNKFLPQFLKVAVCKSWLVNVWVQNDQILLNRKEKNSNCETALGYEFVFFCY